MSEESSKKDEPSISDTGGEKEECSWCKWMKAGGCTEQFEVWMKCVDDVREQGRDDVESCSKVMGPLWECMAANQAYYAPQLDSLQEGDRSGKQGGETEAAGGSSRDSDDVTAEEVERYLESLDKNEAGADKK